MKAIISVVIFLCFLSGCAALEPRVQKVSLQSYEQGCALRGIQRGMPGEDARQACRCHVEKAIALTSPEQFMQKVELVAQATPAERDTDAFREAVQLMKSTFNECRSELASKE